MIELFALYKGKTKDGKTKLSGKLGNNWVTVLANDKKTNEKQPDFRVFISKPVQKDAAPNNFAPKAVDESEGFGF